MGSSPMPNQMISSGIRPTTGTVRSIWIGASMMSSPTLNSPAISAAITAAVSAEEQPESDPLRGRQDRLLQLAGTDQLAGLRDDVLRRGQGVRGQPPRSLATYQSSSSSSGLIALIGPRGAAWAGG